jgi:long-chain acyl-CoA synthetase
MTRTLTGPPLDTAPEPHLLAALWRWAERDPNRPLLSQRIDGDLMTWNASELREQITALAAGLIAHGLDAGDRVLLVSRTCAEWILLDHAILAAGGVSVPVYDTASSAQVAVILANSGARLALTETAEHARIVDEAARAAEVQIAVRSIEDGAVTDLQAAGVDHLDVVAERLAALGNDDLAAIIYSSGTTGEPKGCELTHGNLGANVRQTVQQVPDLFVDGARTVAFLPLAHALGRMQVHASLDQGVELAATSDLDALPEELARVRPTFLVGVPRLFEKVLAGARARALASGRVRVYDRAMAVAEEVSRRRRGGRPLSPWLRVQYLLSDRLVLQRVREALGGFVSLAICGGAPLLPEVGHRFDGIGIPILEGFGATETAPIVSGGPTEPLEIGTVGRPYPATTIRLDDAGEILIRGPQVFRGYRGDPQTTALAMEDGWYRTGDLGEFTDGGSLRIIGRQKDILITAGGKNVVPAPLEDRIRAHPLVEECVVLGDGRPFVTALLWLDEAAVARLLEDAEVAREADQEALLRAELDPVVDAANLTVSRAESIGRYAIMSEPLSLEAGSLTPTAKVRRGVVLERFADSIDQLYVRS